MTELVFLCLSVATFSVLAIVDVCAIACARGHRLFHSEDVTFGKAEPAQLSLVFVFVLWSYSESANC